MGEFFKKNGIVCVVAGYVASMVGLVGSSIYRMVKQEKREKEYYKKQSDVQDSMIDYYRTITKKES